MAKRRNKSVPRRDPLDSIANAFEALPSEPVSFSSSTTSYLQPVEDRRTFYPAPVLRPVRMLSGVRASLGLKPRSQPKPPAARLQTAALFSSRSVLGFKAPNQVVMCIRRKRRREVLHAKGKAGGKVRPPRRNFWSRISCK